MANGTAPTPTWRSSPACTNASTVTTWTRSAARSSAPNLVWNLPGHHPLAGTKNGPDEVLAFFAALRRANIQVTLDPAADPATGIDTFGDSTVVEVHRGRGEVTVPDAAARRSPSG